MKISIIIPSYNHFSDCLKPCLDSLVENTTLDGIEIIIVANGCTDETEEYIKSLGSPFQLLSFPEPLGYTKSINEGLKIASGEYIVLLNNDTIFLDWKKKDLWIESLLNPFKENPKCGLSGPLLEYSRDADSKFLIFFCVMLSRKVYEEVGCLDEIFSPGSGEDIDYCIKAMQKGFEIIQVGNFPIYHAAEKTVKDLPDWNDIYKRNMDVLRERYNLKLKLSNNYERAVIGKNDDVPPRETTRYKWAVENLYGKKVLEIGCSSGYSLKFLKNIPGLKYLGIDYDQTIIDYAKENFGDIPNVKFQQADINEFKLKQYDTIIAFEVIEHLVNGKEIIQKLKKHCKRLLVSTPYNETIGVWGEHHVLHNLTEKDFPDFKYCCINNDGILQQEMLDQKGLSLMLMKWSDESIKNPKVGVITPIYNDEEHIDEAINSVVNQGYSNYVHFVYDDGSTDGSKDKVKKYHHIKLIESDEKKGQSNARNALIKEAIKEGCEYIAFLDSDDVWYPNHLSESVYRLEDNDVVYGKPEWHDGKIKMIPYGIPIPRKFIGKQLEYNNFIWISGVVLKSKCIKNNEFDSGLDGLEDWDLWYRLFKEGYKFTGERPTTFKYLVREGGEASTSYLKTQALREKHKFNLPQLKLHVACGLDYQEGYINSDLYPIQVNGEIRHDAVFDVKEIPYDDNSVDEIRALHVIEHFDFHETQKVLSEWFRVLKPTGKLVLETPDFLTTCKAFVESEEGFRVLLYGHFFAFPWLPGQTHKFLFTEEQLRTQLSWVGFKSCRRIYPISNYVRPDTIDLFLTMEAYKQENNLPIVYDKAPEITCVINTKDRYFSTLPHTLLAICNQTYKPKFLIIYDDGEHKDLQGDPLYAHIFSLLTFYGISWGVVFGEGKGQVLNHIKSLELAKTEWLWRIDDDEYPERDVLEKLVKSIRPDVGAVGGLVITSTGIQAMTDVASNKIEDIYLGSNEQWFLQKDTKPREVDHLYSSFIYRKSIAEYCAELSPVGHREESMLTYGIKRKGYKVILDPRAKTWHFRNPVGGLRSHEGQQNYANDESIFARKMLEWGIKPNNYSYAVLDNGLGDHYAFKYWLPEYLKMNKDKSNILFVCFPEVFEGIPGIKIGSIAEAKGMLGDIDRFSVYKWMIDKRYDKRLMFAFKHLYNIPGGVREKNIRGKDGNTIIVSPYSFHPDHPKSYPFWDELIPMLKKTGLKIVQIGRKDEVPLNGVDDFWKSLPLKELEKRILGCRVWVSVDNFIQHMVNCMDIIVPGIVIWGVSNPDLFGYDQNDNILKSKKFLMDNQFASWSEIKRDIKVFESAENVFKVIEKYV